MPVPETTRLLHELEGTVEENLNRHLAAAQEWMPHEYVPWSQGRDFAELGGEAWGPTWRRPPRSSGTRGRGRSCSG